MIATLIKSVSGVYGGILSKKSQKEAGKIALSYLDDDLVFLDTETTGLGYDDEIIEISIIDKHGNILLDDLIKPKKSIPLSASNIHHITNNDVINCPAWPDIYHQYRDAVKNKTVIIYNKKFDNRLLRQTCGKYGLATPRIKSVCLMELYSLYKSVVNNTGGYKWFRLSDAISENEIITAGGFHRALCDVVASRKLLYFMAGKDEFTIKNEAEEKLISLLPCNNNNTSEHIINKCYDINNKPYDRYTSDRQYLLGGNEKSNKRTSFVGACFFAILFIMSCCVLIFGAMSI